MKRFLRRIFRVLLKAVFWFVIITVFWVILYRVVNPPITPLMAIRYFEDDASINKEWKNYEYISANLVLAVIAAEDQNFFDHWGFDIEAIEDAIEHNKKKKRKRGASTITQQVAKNVFLWSSRNWFRKGLEAYFTVLIEIFWSKKRVLEIYLNVVELGDGIYGAEAASQTYFKKIAMGLSEPQAALLAAVLPNPRKYSASKPNSYVFKRRAWIQLQMNNLGGIKFLNQK